MSFKGEETQQLRRLPVFMLRQEVRWTAVLFGSLIEEGDFFFSPDKETLLQSQLSPTYITDLAGWLEADAPPEANNNKSNNVTREWGGCR